MSKISFNETDFYSRAIDHVKASFQTKRTSGDGVNTEWCKAFLSNLISGGSSDVLMTTSCTDALELASILIDIQPGDEVIIPSYTFVSTANAFALRGAKIVWADISDEDLNLDVTNLKSLITANTKAIVPVHYAGVECDMEAIMDIADDYGLWVVEDAAQGINSYNGKRHVGSLGHLSCFSFHETKNISCGEGGCLVINDSSLISRAHIIRDKGTNRREFFLGNVDKYSWVSLGSSFLPSDLTMAFLRSSLENIATIQSKRDELWRSYFSSLLDTAENHGIRLPSNQANSHIFYLIMPDQESRDSLLLYLNQNNIGAVFHYIPLHSSNAGEKFGVVRTDMSYSEILSSRLIRLPLHVRMTVKDVSRIVELIQFFLK
jgi:dTDP-4-amino-4,6-dideoxygalactose transaminase